MRQLLYLLFLLLITGLIALTRDYWSGSRLEWSVVALLIVVAGIPHGSLDHLVARHRTNQFRLPLYLASYLIIAGLYLALWLLLPGISFLLFLGLTAWHFGETDFNCFRTGKNHPLLVFVYGCALTCWLLTQDAQLLQELVALISGNSTLAKKTVNVLLQIPGITWLILCSLLLLEQGSKSITATASKLTFLLFLYLLSHTSLLLGFVLYFTGWHSMNALLHIRREVFHNTSITAMLQKAAPATLGALLLLLLLGWLSEGAWLKANALPALFVLLSILTLPHMMEMHHLYRKTRGTPPGN